MASAREIAGRVRMGEVSPLDLVEESLRRIDALDAKVGAWAQVRLGPGLELEAGQVICDRWLAIAFVST
jgi:Asp-tRNA(Asn)/Glu-tRNA(Gln) amidotransferase A subunit family amidase